MAHTHLVRCAIKLAPSVPAAKVKRVMFVYLLEVLNGDGPASSFFAPHRPSSPRVVLARPASGGPVSLGKVGLSPSAPWLLTPPLLFHRHNLTHPVP